jgi:AcrR family transcriptional regulator
MSPTLGTSGARRGFSSSGTGFRVGRTESRPGGRPAPGGARASHAPSALAARVPARHVPRHRIPKTATESGILMHTTPANPAPAQARLSEERRRVICAAVRELLEDVGFEALTMDMVSAKARTSKATLYRRWQHKSRLVAAALEQSERIHIDAIDTGSLAGDLDEVATKTGEDGGRTARLLSSVTHAVRGDSHLAEALRTHVVEGHLEALRLLLRRAVDRGEVAGDCPALAYFPQLVLGAMLSQRPVTGADPDADHLRAYFTCVVLPSLGHRPR